MFAAQSERTQVESEASIFRLVQWLHRVVFADLGVVTRVFPETGSIRLDGSAHVNYKPRFA